MISLQHNSHKDPEKYRVKYNDASKVFAGNYFQDNTLPVKHSQSAVAIIGAGFSGIATAIECINKLKIDDFVIFEKHDEFGGTWYANTYPGCASDIPAIWYSLSTDMNNTWSSSQPPQYEIEEYILSVAEKYDLRPRAKFQTAVERVVYNESEGNWTMDIRDLANGQLIKHTAKVIISNIGGLVVPSHLKAKGLDTFKGKYMHSALYDHSVTLKGKKVVVVGAGCSACQLIPRLLNDYEPESVVQVARSTQYIMPPVPSQLQWLYRRLSSSLMGLKLLRLMVIAIAEMRYPMFRGAGLLSRLIRKITRAQSLRYMNKKCPEKYKKMIIPEFTIGCKRLIFDHNYMDSLKDSKIDVVSSKIKEITSDSVIFENGVSVQADVIIACTGYDLNRSFESVEIIGKDGFNVTQMWREAGPSAYNTTLVKNAPNLFMIGGPNIATGHSSFVESCENALKYVSIISKSVLDGTNKSICVKPDVYDNWVVKIQADLRNAVFGSEFGGCKSWYASDGFNATTYPYSQLYFWWSCKHPNYNDLEYEKTDKKLV